MFCIQCGQPSKDPHGQACESCGAALPTRYDARGAAASEFRFVVPVGVSPFAVLAFLGGFVSLVIPFLGPLVIFSAIATFAHLAKRKDLRGHARAIIGLLLGVVSSFVFVFLIIFMASL